MARNRVFSLVGITLVAALSVTAAAYGIPRSSALTVVEDGSSNPCLPVMQNLEKRNPDTIRATGLSDMMPEFLARDYVPGGLYCLSDELAGRIEAIYIEFWRSNKVQLAWMTVADEVEDYPWESYLASVAQPLTPTVMRIADGQLLSVLEAANVPQVRFALERSGPAVSAGMVIAESGS